MKRRETDATVYLRCGAVPVFVNPEQYVGMKLDMLRKDMKIKPSKEEVEHLYSLKTEGDIDRAVCSIIGRHWADF